MTLSNILERPVKDVPFNDLKRFVESVEKIGAVQNSVEESDEANWITRAEAMQTAEIARGNNFSDWYKRKKIRTRGTGSSKEYFRPDIIQAKSQRRRAEAA